jgi:hypothetical protein
MAEASSSGKFQGTPGPWRVDWHGDGYASGESSVELACLPHDTFDAIEIMCALGSRASLAEHEANARLIAAAPDLLEAIKALSASIFAPDDGRSPELSAALRMTVSAIAKAEGGAESLPLSTEGEEGR